MNPDMIIDNKIVAEEIGFIKSPDAK